MKKLFVIIVLLFITLLLTGCPPEENKFYKQFDNYYMNANIQIDVNRIYQNDNDVIVLDITDRNIVLKDFYIKANTLELLQVKLWGIEINEVSKDGEMYYWVDARYEKVKNKLYLELIVGKNEVYKDAYYEENLKMEAVIHSFDCFFNERDTKEEYRFGKEYFNDPNNDYQEEMIFLNGLDEVLTKTYFDSLYLPFDNKKIVTFSKEIIYYPNQKYLVLNESNNYFDIVIINGSSLNNNGNPIDYSYNDIDFKISKNIFNYELSYVVQFIIQIDDNKSNTYRYHIFDDNLDSVKDFLRTIDIVRLDD